ncbi:MAG: class II fructose-bisphosphate aldolase [Eubacteriales bacterium]|nr:class II fructose-bisphosphate aldolase [Eubacteriales bacterium]
MIVSSKEIYKLARERNFAVPGTNFVDALSAASHVETAEKCNLPTILSFAQSHQCYLPWEDAFAIGKYYANKSKAPVVLHLDHGTDKEFIFKAVDAGFSSVMIDASSKSFEDNVRLTSEIVKYAHLRGVVVEAEIGHVGEGNEYQDQKDNNNIYTTVEEAKKFVELTEVDSLAISIGTAHGAYKGTPVINFDRLTEIRNSVEVPLVLHGGSSSGDDNLHRCAVGGISKINIYTDFVQAAYKKVQESEKKDYFAVRDAMKQGMGECLEHYYNIFETKKYAEN